MAGGAGSLSSVLQINEEFKVSFNPNGHVEFFNGKDLLQWKGDTTLQTPCARWTDLRTLLRFTSMVRRHRNTDSLRTLDWSAASTRCLRWKNVSPSFQKDQLSFFLSEEKITFIEYNIYRRSHDRDLLRPPRAPRALGGLLPRLSS